MFLLVSVILSTGGCLPQCMLGYHPPGADTPRKQTTPQEQTPPQSTHTHTQSRHPHPPREQTVNERPVRILLECILVGYFVLMFIYRSKLSEWNRHLLHPDNNQGGSTKTIAYDHTTIAKKDKNDCISSGYQHYYRPQTKFAKVMFLHLSVILFTGGGMHGGGMGGMCGRGGVGHAWWVGVHGGHVWLGACMADTTRYGQ